MDDFYSCISLSDVKLFNEEEVGRVLSSIYDDFKLFINHERCPFISQSENKHSGRVRFGSLVLCYTTALQLANNLWRQTLKCDTSPISSRSRGTYGTVVTYVSCA